MCLGNFACQRSTPSDEVSVVLPLPSHIYIERGGRDFLFTACSSILVGDKCLSRLAALQLGVSYIWPHCVPVGALSVLEQYFGYQSNTGPPGRTPSLVVLETKLADDVDSQSRSER
ncbi:hypothetical protein PsYK624_002700 [Phanerochaete sordida]|uniref:Uncharacterized protein n=1 Tax=Phanerochaete sordida TaxID=48140 RepID=A0A9P3FXL9_9APHY|nr:hypothetical protein PsYK624_002700 [Phanerochaete sordida]